MSEKEKFEQEEKAFESEINAKFVAVFTIAFLVPLTSLVIWAKIFVPPLEIFPWASLLIILSFLGIFSMGFSLLQKRIRIHLAYLERNRRPNEKEMFLLKDKILNTLEELKADIESLKLMPSDETKS